MVEFAYDGTPLRSSWGEHSHTDTYTDTDTHTVIDRHIMTTPELCFPCRVIESGYKYCVQLQVLFGASHSLTVGVRTCQVFVSNYVIVSKISDPPYRHHYI
jgi:hypothetical protein